MNQGKIQRKFNQGVKIQNSSPWSIRLFGGRLIFSLKKVHLVFHTFTCGVNVYFINYFRQRTFELQHKDVLVRRLWETDILLDYEITEKQVIRQGKLRKSRVSLPFLIINICWFHIIHRKWEDLLSANVDQKLFSKALM